ncbi:hypothetical protein K493DRAFT_80977 [Basidiobolus meristosporus CBS 931.73]|uniref:Importin N-terminal domain-containing protein n=1 Tax=Basidiobolus meristosporus CBS 931.73 TaxID=1314790 RepID=A0A1Y1XPT6_9FUNG|nr:hypothetical protein K493DRAFT_80977 [Basidiobolus meristosporus CBS 931.73]|eukprot:ORX87526.1 hypothetical protein K493DRAFT_80977 [Basidiobolus meristosporus CBS 931.73]
MSLSSRNQTPDMDVADGTEENLPGIIQPESKKEKLHREILERITRLNEEFELRKSKLFREKSDGLSRELKQIYHETHPEFKASLEELVSQRDESLYATKLYREYLTTHVERIYEAEVQKAEEEYEREKQGIKEKLLATIEEKKSKLKEDKDSSQIINEYAIESPSRSHSTRKLRKRNMEHTEVKPTKRRNLSGPAISIALKEEEIREDMTMLRGESSSSDDEPSHKAHDIPHGQSLH